MDRNLGIGIPVFNVNLPDAGPGGRQNHSERRGMGVEDGAGSLSLPAGQLFSQIGIFLARWF